MSFVRRYSLTVCVMKLGGGLVVFFDSIGVMELGVVILQNIFFIKSVL